MVSPLWKAASDGDVQKVLELLNAPSAVDIEIKDHAGVTPLIEAVRNGRVEIVRVLLEKGANPSNSSNQGPPESHTSDSVMLELLRTAQSKTTQNGMATHQAAYNEREGENPENRFYAPSPPDAYTYYPTINPSLSTVNESVVYYPLSQPQPSADGSSPNGLGNLPPPEIARLIPCRYFPACRYGAQCMFAHPQTTYFQGPMPPVPYPPYDPMGHQYVPQFYPSPPNFQPPPPAGHPMSPPPGPPVIHTRTPSEVVSPSLGHFSPSGAPPPPIPYGPLSPPVYPHPGQVPVGIQQIPPLPPLHPHAPHPAPPSHPNLYNSSSVPPFPLHQDVSGPFPLPVPPSNVNYPDANGTRPPETPQAENYNAQANHREGGNGHRRGSGRRPSFGARKPPCLFFPSGRCKNGDDCRFPHVLPENAGTPTQSSFTPPRGGAPRARSHMNGPNGLGNLESKLGNMSIRDEPPRQKNGVEGSSRSHSSDAGSRPKFQQGSKQPNGLNGHKKAASFKPQPQQRVPRADEFPVLAGTITPPRVNGTGHNGPTAAQVLQAPPPLRKEGSKESSTRGTTPDLTQDNTDTVKETKTEVNDSAHENTTPAQGQHIVNNVTKLPVMSFAAAAAATGATADVSKEVSVSA